MLYIGMIVERTKLKQQLRSDLRCKSKAQVAHEIGIPAMTLGRIMRGKSAGSIATWEAIARHYSHLDCVAES